MPDTRYQMNEIKFIKTIPFKEGFKYIENELPEIPFENHTLLPNVKTIDYLCGIQHIEYFYNNELIHKKTLHTDVIYQIVINKSKSKLYYELFKEKTACLIKSNRTVKKKKTDGNTIYSIGEHFLSLNKSESILHLLDDNLNYKKDFNLKEISFDRISELKYIISPEGYEVYISSGPDNHIYKYILQ